MSDPMQRPDANPAATEPRKGTNPLVWILLLIALVAFGWWFLTQRGADAPPAIDPVTAPAEPVVSEQEAAAERERAATAEREARQAAAPRNTEAAPVAEITPAYPPTALRAREEGSVVVEASVDATGAVTDASVVERSRSRDLDRAALDAVRKTTFKPATEGGKAVASTVRVPIEFKLENQ